MQMRCVIGAERRSDAALSPSARGLDAKRLWAEHGNRHRRQTQRRREAGEPAADDDGSALMG